MVISLVDPASRDTSELVSTPIPNLPNKAQLKKSIEAFKNSLELTNDEIRELERKTREQRNSPKWFAARRFQITASIFGDIIHRRPATAPDNLVKCILQQKRFFSVQTEWGINKEEEALQSYIDYQNKNGHVGLTVHKIGFLVMESHPYIGASPDGDVYDPSS